MRLIHSDFDKPSDEARFSPGFFEERTRSFARDRNDRPWDNADGLHGHTLVTNALLWVESDVPRGRRSEASQRILSNYWEEFDGWLITEPVLAMLRRSEDEAGHGFIVALDGVRNDFDTAQDSLYELHAARRSQCVRWGTSGGVDPHLVRIAEFFVDFCLIQRFDREDLKLTGRMVTPGERVSLVIERLNLGRQLASQGALQYFGALEFQRAVDGHLDDLGRGYIQSEAYRKAPSPFPVAE